MTDQPSLFQQGQDLPLFSGKPDVTPEPKPAPKPKPILDPAPKTPTVKTLADVLYLEHRRLEQDYSKRGMVYLNFPYPCCITEAMAHAKKYRCPPAARTEIVRTDNHTHIHIKPERGSGYRKPLTIHIWKA